jgi:hypothetical protein
MTALLAVLVIGFSAFAVDLGNAFARQRVLQTQADLAALAGATELPDLTRARALAVDYLNRNAVQGGPSTFDVSAFGDGNTSNGEVRYNAGNPNELEVIAPPARVDFGLGRVLGVDGTDQSATGVAGIFSPGALGPFFLPSGCLTPSGGGVANVLYGTSATAAGVEPAFFPSPSRPPNDWPLVGSVSPFELVPNQSAPELTLEGDDLDNVVEVGFVWSGDPALRVTTTDITVTPGVRQQDSDRVEVNVVPSEVTTLPFPEVRIVYIQVRTDGASQWSVANVASSVKVPDPGADLPDECGENNQGDFGLIFSPRLPAEQQQNTIQKNYALGLDHALTVYPGGASALNGQGILPFAENRDRDICQTETADPPLYTDVAANRTRPPNCVDIVPGAKTASPDIGLIKGEPGLIGRLDSPASLECGATRVVNFGRSITINDDRLSCFLPGTSSVGDVIFSNNPPQLAPSIVESPRFVLVPVIHADIPPGQGGYPIVDFKGALISNEETSSTKATPRVVPQNGVTLTGNGRSVQAITVMYFNLSALPEVISTNGNVVSYIGSGPKVVRLVE